jgi:hypothetical protein
MGEKILTNDGIKEIEIIDIPPVEPTTEEKEKIINNLKISEEDKKNVNPQEREETFAKPELSKKKIEKRDAIKEFNENPKTREYGAKLIDKKLYISLLVIAGAFIMLLSINMIWGNLLLGKFSDKDFSVNVQPSNVSMTDADINNIFNNLTIVNNVTIPSNITLNCKWINES